MYYICIEPLLAKVIVDQWKQDKSWFAPTNTKTCAEEEVISNLKNIVNVTKIPEPEKSPSSHQFPLVCTIQSIINNIVDAQMKRKESMHSMLLVKLERQYVTYCVVLKQTSICEPEMISLLFS